MLLSGETNADSALSRFAAVDSCRFSMSLSSVLPRSTEFYSHPHPRRTSWLPHAPRRTHRCRWPLSYISLYDMFSMHKNNERLRRVAQGASDGVAQCQTQCLTARETTRNTSCQCVCLACPDAHGRILSRRRDHAAEDDCHH
jgi:hypothetical protein